MNKNRILSQLKKKLMKLRTGTETKKSIEMIKIPKKKDYMLITQGNIELKCAILY